ncbi:MAG: DUF87 domain-containing protein [Candidatus Methanoperedens sp.]
MLFGKKRGAQASEQSSTSKLSIFNPEKIKMMEQPLTKRFIVDAAGSEVIYSSSKDAFVLIKVGRGCVIQTIDRIEAFIDWYRALPDSGVFSAMYNPLYPEANTTRIKDGPEASLGGFISYVLSPEIKTIFLGTVVKPIVCDLKNKKETARIMENMWIDEKKHEKSIIELRSKKRRIYTSITSRLGGLQVSPSMVYNSDTGVDEFVFIKRKQSIMLGPFFEEPTKILNKYAYHELESGGKKRIRAYGFLNIGNLMGKMGRGSGDITKGSPIEILVLKKETIDIAKSRKDFEEMGRDTRLSNVLKGLAGTGISCSLNVIWEPINLNDFKERLHRDDKYSQMKSRDRQVTESDNMQMGPKYSGVSRTIVSPLQDQGFLGQTYRTQYLWRGLQRGLFNANVLLAVASEGDTFEEATRQLEVNLHTAVGVVRGSFDTVMVEIVEPEEALQALYLLTPSNFEKEDDGLVHDTIVNNEILSIFGHLPDFPLPADIDIIKFPDLQGRLTRRNLGLDKSNPIYFARAVQDFKHVSTVAIDAINDPRLIGVICGKIGSGKTNTMKRILKETLDGDELGPFSDVLILDRHGEYHKLCSATDTEVFVVPLWSSEVIFKINVLESVEGRSIGQAVEDAAALFKHTMVQIGPIMESVCREALHDLYKKHGWTVNEIYTRADSRSIPTCRDLLDHLKHGRYWEERKREGMKAETSQRYREAMYSLVSRLEKIMAAQGENIFCPENGRSTVPPAVMFSKNVIIQFMFGKYNPIDDDAKNFVSLMFIQHLWNYRQVNAIKLPDDKYDRKKYYGINPDTQREIIRKAMQKHMCAASFKNGIAAQVDDFIVEIKDGTVIGKGTIECQVSNDNKIDAKEFGEGFTVSAFQLKIKEEDKLSSSKNSPLDELPQTQNSNPASTEMVEVTCTSSVERLIGAPMKIHTLVIEEAHNIAQDRSDEFSNSISLISQILSEIRKFGEGIWIIDQLPELLDERVLKLANNLIVHKTDEDYAVAKLAATLGILEEPQMYEFLKVLSPGMALLKLNSSQAAYPIEVCYPRLKRPELTEQEIIDLGKRFRDICREDEKNFKIPVFQMDQQVYDSKDMRERSFKSILSYAVNADIKISNPKFALLSIAAHNEYFASPKTKSELLMEYKKLWGRDFDEMQMNELMEMGLLIENTEKTTDSNDEKKNDTVYVLTDKGKQAIASSVYLFSALLYHYYDKKREAEVETEAGVKAEVEPKTDTSTAVNVEIKPGEEDAELIFTNLIGNVSGKSKNDNLSKNKIKSESNQQSKKECQLSHQPPFAFIVTCSKTIGVLSKIDALDTVIDRLRNKSMDEVIIINEGEMVKSMNLHDLKIPGLRVLSKTELIDLVEMEKL